VISGSLLFALQHLTQADNVYLQHVSLACHGAQLCQDRC
jgi:hypothetical protein